VTGGGDRLLGRTSELESLARELASPEGRLVTLTGPPGVGKTRLATSAAAAASDRFPGGTALVDLSSSGSPDDALLEMCHAVTDDPRSRAGPRDRLAGWLLGRSFLMVLDNCEAVSGLGPVVASLLREIAGLRVLATSRERLRVGLEREFPVPPLAMPGAADLHDLARLGRVPAVEMLVERTRRVRPDFTLHAGNSDAVAAICRELEGLPLALEVAAARLAQFDPPELAARLRNRQLLLDGGARAGPGRHRTLRTAISWSHDLLPEEQRLLFRRVSVFPGPWTLVAAEAVVGEPGLDLLGATTGLVEKNLLRRATRDDGSEAYGMLGSLRQYAADELDRHGERDATRRRHSRYYADLASTAEAGFGTPDEALWWDWVGLEQANLRSALTESVQRDDVVAALPLASAIGWFCYTRGQADRAYPELSRVVAAAQAADMEESMRSALAGALLISGILAGAQRDLGRAGNLLREAVEISAATADARRAAIAHAFLGHVARAAGDPADAEARHSEAAVLYERAGNDRGVAWSMHDLGLTALDRDQVERAEELLSRSQDFFAAAGDDWALAWTRLGLAEAALARGSLQQAARLFVDAFEGYAAAGDFRGAAHSAVGSAAVRCDEGSTEAAARLLELARVLEPAGDAFALATASRAKDLRSRVEDALGRPGGLPADVPPGRPRGMSREAALDAIRALLVPEPTPAEDSPLTPRQRQVAGLVAGGGTNRQIARALGITEKTVEVHLTQIRARLGARSRTQVATHAVRARLDRPAAGGSDAPGS
jgi:non-specific serine/threonine protein kinase